MVLFRVAVRSLSTTLEHSQIQIIIHVCFDSCGNFIADVSAGLSFILFIVRLFTPGRMRASVSRTVSSHHYFRTQFQVNALKTPSTNECRCIFQLNRSWNVSSSGHSYYNSSLQFRYLQQERSDYVLMMTNSTCAALRSRRGHMQDLPDLKQRRGQHLTLSVIALQWKYNKPSLAVCAERHRSVQENTCSESAKLPITAMQDPGFDNTIEGLSQLFI
jgi:hypothetical protein